MFTRSTCNLGVRTVKILILTATIHDQKITVVQQARAVSSCQMDPERQPYKVVKSAVTTTQLAAEGGATLVIAALRLRRASGARPIQEAVRLFSTADGTA